MSNKFNALILEAIKTAKIKKENLLEDLQNIDGSYDPEVIHKILSTILLSNMKKDELAKLPVNLISTQLKVVKYLVEKSVETSVEVNISDDLLRILNSEVIQLCALNNTKLFSFEVSELNQLIDLLQDLVSCTFDSKLYDSKKGQLMGDILIVKIFLEKNKMSLIH